MASSDAARRLLGQWRADFDMPITYTFVDESRLSLRIHDMQEVALQYSVSTAHDPWHLDIEHAGDTGTGTERCIFRFHGSGCNQELHIASPLPQEQQEFGERPTAFGGVTTVVFAKPEDRAEMQREESAKVEGWSTERKLKGYCTAAAAAAADS